MSLLKSIMSKTRARTRKSSVVTLLLALPLFLSLTHCGAAMPPSAGLEPCGGPSCQSTNDCMLKTPVCAQGSSSTCLNTTPRECAWKLNISAYCPCIEHDVRLCSYNGGPGVQICNKTSSSSTAWSACMACPSCS